MRTIVSTVFLVLLASLLSCSGNMDETSDDYATPVIRTDFTDEAAWQKIRSDVAAKNMLGFSANVRFIDDRQYRDLAAHELLQRIAGLEEYGCIFVADSMAMSAAEHHLLVLDPFNPTGKTFRVIPSEAWGVENNLSISNMDYSEFYDSADADGVFRGFR